MFRNRFATFGLLVVGLACWTGLACYLHRGHTGDVMDDGLYFVAAQALAQGAGNTLPSQVGPPVRSRYPVGVAALVSVALRVAPGTPSLVRDAAVARGVIVATGWIFFLAAFIWLRRSRVSRAWAMLIVLATAFHPVVVMSALAVMSDIPFAAVAALLLGRGARRKRREGGIWDPFVDGLLCGVALALRGNGVALLPGACIRAVQGHAPRQALVRLLALGLGVAALVLGARWLVALGNDGRVVAGGYGGEMTAGLTSPQTVATLVGGHVRDVVQSLPFVIAPVLETNAFRAVPLVVHVLVTGLIVVLILWGALGIARSRGARGRDLSAWSYALCLIAIFIAWPGWFNLRFLISLFPMILLAFGRGTKRVGRRLGLRRAATLRLGTAALVACLLCDVGFMGQVVLKAHAAGGLWGNPVMKRELDTTLDAVRNSLPGDAVIASMTPELVFLETGRQGFLLMQEDDRTLSRLGRLDRIADGMDRADGRPCYLLGLAPDPDGALEARQCDAYAQHPALVVKEVFRSPGGRYWVARVGPK